MSLAPVFPLAVAGKLSVRWSLRARGVARIATLALCISILAGVLAQAAFAEEALPDGRTYEMVTPTGNHDADVYVPYAYGQVLSQGTETFFPFQVTSNGEAITYVGDASIGGEGTVGKGLGDQYLATRRPDGGWQQTTIQPASHSLGTHFQGFSGAPVDLSTGLLISGISEEPGLPPLAANAPDKGYSVLYARDDFGVQTGLEEELYAPLFAIPQSSTAKPANSGRRSTSPMSVNMVVCRFLLVSRLAVSCLRPMMICYLGMILIGWR